MLDLRALQNRVVATNLANEETPGFRAKEVHFKEALAAARHDGQSVTLHVTTNRHLLPNNVGGRISEIPAGDLPLDANSVNLELEMAKLSDIAMQYKATAEILRKEFQHLLEAIREGR
jgi:flagellar basal-body rod protein FlgB